jgi:hypothetical protein
MAKGVAGMGIQLLYAKKSNAKSQKPYPNKPVRIPPEKATPESAAVSG